jgi:hypothetical protein
MWVACAIYQLRKVNQLYQKAQQDTAKGVLQLLCLVNALAKAGVLTQERTPKKTAKKKVAKRTTKKKRSPKK